MPSPVLAHFYTATGNVVHLVNDDGDCDNNNNYYYIDYDSNHNNK